MKARVCGFTKEEIAVRIGDLCNTCDELSDKKNFQIAIDTVVTNYEPIWTIDNILMHRQLNWDEKTNYQASYWDSDENEIIAFNARFDSDFLTLQSQMHAAFSLLKISSLSQYIYHVTSDWVGRHQIF